MWSHPSIPFRLGVGESTLIHCFIYKKLFHSDTMRLFYRLWVCSENTHTPNEQTNKQPATSSFFRKSTFGQNWLTHHSFWKKPQNMFSLHLFPPVDTRADASRFHLRIIDSSIDRLSIRALVVARGIELLSASNLLNRFPQSVLIGYWSNIDLLLLLSRGQISPYLLVAAGRLMGWRFQHDMYWWVLSWA